MKVIRFIGIDELKNLLRDGEVCPLHNKWQSIMGNGVVKDRPVLWFFPFVSDEDFKKNSHRDWSNRELDSPFDRLSYCIGIVTNTWATIDGERKAITICLHLDLPKKDLQEDVQLYADPEGSYYDRTSVREYLLSRPYKASEVEMVELYSTYEENRSKALLGAYAMIREAMNFLTASGVR